MWCFYLSKINIAEKLIFSELLRYIVDDIKHIQVSFVHTNAIDTIVRVGGVSTQQKGIMLKIGSFLSY